jgi:hypothetical protein
VVVVVQEGLRTGIVHYAVDGRLHVLIPKRAGAWGGLNSQRVQCDAVMDCKPFRACRCLHVRIEVPNKRYLRLAEQSSHIRRKLSVFVNPQKIDKDSMVGKLSSPRIPKYA